MLNDVMLVVKRFGCAIQQQEVQLFCHMALGVPQAQEAYFLERMRNLHTVEMVKMAAV